VAAPKRQDLDGDAGTLRSASPLGRRALLALLNAHGEVSAVTRRLRRARHVLQAAAWPPAARWPISA